MERKTGSHKIRQKEMISINRFMFDTDDKNHKNLNRLD